MTCPRCKISMEVQKRIFHKQRKWICRRCGFTRFEQLPKNRRRPTA